jgi:RNA polymerase sigma factor (sigma-70 family)
MRQALLDALAALEPRQREVVLLHDLENWTHPEIAAALGISEVWSRQHLFRARQLLRAKLGAGPRCEENHGP